ncbi:hypothetical protein M5D96_000110, partial [Drosophila gunungcola]
MSYPSKDRAFKKILNGERGQVFVRFRDFGNELPKLTFLNLNGQVLCESDEYEAPFSTMTRVRNISISAPIRQSTLQEILTSPVLTRSPAVIRNDINPWPREETDFDQCGVEGFASLLIGGEQVTRGQYPWLAGLYKGVSFDEYICVVSVISKRTVITAAHCTYGRSAKQLRVYLGRHDRSENPESGASLVSVARVITPPDNKGSTVPDTDVGLLVLDDPIEYTKYIQPLCLWNEDLELYREEGERGLVAGWGYDSKGGNTRFPKK